MVKDLFENKRVRRHIKEITLSYEEQLEKEKLKSLELISDYYFKSDDIDDYFETVINERALQILKEGEPMMLVKNLLVNTKYRNTHKHLGFKEQIINFDKAVEMVEEAIKLNNFEIDMIYRLQA